MTVEALERPHRTPLWLAALAPLVLLGVLLAVIVRFAPAGALRGEAAPPVERLAIERATLRDDGIVLSVLNDGPDPVTIAQVSVDDAYWAFTAEGATTIDHLGRTTLHIPYPWVSGDAHLVKILTSTGATFAHEIPVALKSPGLEPRMFGTFALIGLYVGVIPVALGLLWYPVVARLGRTGLEALLALTVGLLAFLFVDAAHEGLDIASGAPESYQGAALFVAAAASSYLALETLGAWLRARRAERTAEGGTGFVLALLIAVGIGLHNFGEGLAIGAAFSLGEAALGTLLIVGFTLHNTTEGLAIVAPLAKDRPSVPSLVRLGLIGGLPTIAGAWAGGFVYSPVVAIACLGLGAGAIAQVIGQILKQMRGTRSMIQHLATAPVMLGLLAGFAVMYLTGLVVG